MQDGGTGAGAQHGGAGREANLIFVLPPNVYVGPRQGGLFGFKFSSRPHHWKFGVKRFLVLREVLARKWGGLFLDYLLGKISGGVIALISTRVHHAAWKRGGDMAAPGGRSRPRATSERFGASSLHKPAKIGR